MAAITKLSLVLSIVILFAKLRGLSSTNDPTISASPALLPCTTAPNMCSFFPSPSAQQPSSSATPPNSEVFGPMPSSGEFVGKKSSSSARLNIVAATVSAMLCSLFVIELVPIA
ncbi:Pentatricopeptide repeat-containing protein [Quillaja saponaria]|uniref:Pentatricopeptide repeat-containing protein n=1 Tax=Quillaja saponaria TaxID=32244 RepID=A0AAD7Q7G3_QUISA|nr:Pentatricopeptide repeat-containing protein [Quillaja saponaria]